MKTRRLRNWLLCRWLDVVKLTVLLAIAGAASLIVLGLAAVLVRALTALPLWVADALTCRLLGGTPRWKADLAGICRDFLGNPTRPGVPPLQMIISAGQNQSRAHN